jgi:hypothetical protein
MKLRLLMLVLGLAMVVIPAAAFANGNGSVIVSSHSCSIGDYVLYGGENYIEISIMNDAPLYEISIGLQFTATNATYRFVTPYGSVPSGSPYVEVLNDAVGAFDLGGLQVDTSGLPNSIVLHGQASIAPLATSGGAIRLCYRLNFRAEYVGSGSGQFCVSPFACSPQSCWLFDDGSPYAPTFNLLQVPGAQPICAEMLHLPGFLPVFTAVPPALVVQNRCTPYVFTVQAKDGGNIPALAPIRYYCQGGSIDEHSGLLQVTSPTCSDSSRVTIDAVDCGGDPSSYSFSINWVDTPPAFTNCPIVDGYIDTGQVYAYPFRAYDPDACDKVTYSVGNLGGGPHGAFAIDSTGNFVFTPTADDLGYLYVFDVVANSGCSAIDSCRALVMVGWNTCGDANGDMVLDISDVVSLITYIFQGGLPPNPPSNGDVDCSGGVDISDVVYIVTHIFSDGPGPCDGCK